MRNNKTSGMNRRGLFRSASGVLGGALLSGAIKAESKAPVQNVNTNSTPSKLKITDLRVATIRKPGPSPCTIVRLDTNQGVYGVGEVRDLASPTYALFLKSRVVGENPLNITYIFEKIKQFGGDSRQAGGVVAIEEACWDIAGKVYGVPIYQMLGGKFRDKVRIYADTEESPDPLVYAKRMKARKEEMGITWLKMDLGINLIEDKPGTVTRPAGQSKWENEYLPHPFTGIEVTDKGIALLCEYVAAIREAVGMEIPLSMDHLGHMGVSSIIRLGKAYEKYNLEWMEDVVPWQYTELLQRITNESPTPILTGEDIYLKPNFEKLCKAHAVSKIHPDISTSGGILETHNIGNMAQEYGVAMAMHYAGTPVGAMASVHCAAATENFLACENHSLDVPWWQDMVEGIEKPIINRGFITVPDRPGLGVTLVDEVVKAHLVPGTGYFEPTPQWDKEHSVDRLWSMAPPRKAAATVA
jgi:L-alanine-DL-glutamate epimerase-like enolase superfamily enzyme